MPRTSGRMRRQALTDAICTLGGSVGLGIVLVQFGQASSWGSIAAVASGLTLVCVAVMSLMRRKPLFSTPADRVTLSRAVLGGGCATIVVLALLGPVPHRSWWLVLLAVPAVLLDAVDGWVARRTGTVSIPGSRLDMETDAALMLVLSVPLAITFGPWVLAIGLMRYAFVAASWWRPALRAPLGFSQFRRVVAAIQAVVLAVALIPLVPGPVAAGVLTLSLLLLGTSFLRDIITLERLHRCGEALVLSGAVGCRRSDGAAAPERESA